MRIGLALLVAFGIVQGCSSSGGSSGTATATGSVSAMCQSYCGWRDRCANTDQNCNAECNGDFSRNETKITGAYTNAVEQCFQGLECIKKEDACIGDFARADPAFPNIPEVTACEEKRKECSQGEPIPDSGTTTQPNNAFSDDYCLSIAALTPEARSNANACLSQPCAGIRDCLIQAGAFNY